MKNNWLLSIVLLSACTHTYTYNADVENHLQSLLDNKEYFRLRASFSSAINEINPVSKLLFAAYIENAFNHNLSSNQAIEALMDGIGPRLSDSMKVLLLILKRDNYFKTYDYAKAAQTSREILNHFKNRLDSIKLADITNSAIIDSGLRNTPPQQVHIPNKTTVKWARDKLGIMEIPVRFGDSVYSSVFDTRANISCITASYAKKVGVKILDISYTEGSGITGNIFKSSLGVADSLWIGDILIQHAVFQVFPDDILYFKPIDFSINIIIGYPIIRQLKEFHILQNGTITFPAYTTQSNLHNLAMDALNPVVFGVVAKDTLCFQFDTGANTSDLYNTFYDRYREMILKNGTAKTIKVGGAGGIVDREVYILKELPIQIGSTKAILRDVQILTSPIPGVHQKFYGNLGQDVVSQFNEMIMNFEEMYLEFR